jgi:ABC-type multidrug transport system fused ATPase/permease subunit
MNRMLIGLMLMVVMCSMVFGQTVPQDDNIEVIQAINKEHKDTRKFISDELTRQRDELWKEAEKQALYYEAEAQSFLRKAVFKLGLLWGGIMFLIIGINTYLSRKLEKRKWNKMLESAKEEMRAEFNKQKPEPTIDQKKQLYDLASRLKQQQEELKQIMSKDTITGGE